MKALSNDQCINLKKCWNKNFSTSLNDIYLEISGINKKYLTDFTLFEKNLNYKYF